MNVLMTGAFGIVGSAVREHLADRDEYDSTYLSRSPREEYDMVAADVTDYDAIRPAFEGQDVVVDLALPPGLSTEDRSIGWSDTYAANLRGATNVMEAAVDAGVEKLIYASSNHVVGMYELENAPEIYESGHGIEIDHTVPVRPDSMYGVTKAHSEALARFCADAHGISTYCLRICSVREPESDHPYSDAERGGRPDTEQAGLDRDSEEYRRRVGRMKAMWHSRRDCAHLFDCCLQDDTVDFDVFYGVSDNDRRWMDIDHAREVVGYDPQDNAEEWDSPPA
ncbi:NAD-dependent epimerase/dehydratase family protein [Halomontanus rarus]|uniref:NAD-dependent epimerase/dehydratase family protein n=1 Tax=Halomontanus rarus TaxID=3034020 RepID=UPI0023E7F4D7|nr:NAD(P)-dependent oxidoreductase [Halovivax sp. TS33]